MPRIIELAEFGQKEEIKANKVTFLGNFEMFTITLLAILGMVSAFLTMCYICTRQKR